MFRVAVFPALLALLLSVVALAGNEAEPACESTPGCLHFPALTDAEFERIAERIFVNETGGQVRYLTYWGEGEDFPSFGIGHFIWFPAGVDAPFDESFPAMLKFVADRIEHGPDLPEWIAHLNPLDAPWFNKQTFDASLTTAELLEFRDWLAATSSLQARFIARSFVERWNALALGNVDKARLTALLNTLIRSSDGLFAVLDYYNFKGLGENPRERYAGAGWGLTQVLSDVSESDCVDSEVAAVLECFSEAAAGRLRQRVVLSPPSRNEKRWLGGWLQRVGAYVSKRVGFFVTPYLQNPQNSSVAVVWFSRADNPGVLEVWSSADQSQEASRRIESVPVATEDLSYHAIEIESLAGSDPTAPIFRHELMIDGLDSGSDYSYTVRQGEETAAGTIRMPSENMQELRFMVYGDSETEPESKSKRTEWPGVGNVDSERRYLVDQTTGYAANLDVIMSRQPAFVAIAGDLVESGGEQRDWDEFWQHNAPLAASIPILPALGNHEYYGGPGALGAYSEDASRRALAKYKTYFTLPDSGIAAAASQEHYYSLRYGPISLIVIDTNDGIPHRSSSDTNWWLDSGAAVAPAWNNESAQLAWLEKELQRAQRDSAFTFVMFHTAPYSSGVHNQPPGFDVGRDYLSGLPLRELTPLFMRYGVDAVFNGHDEVYEHSVIQGIEKTLAGLDAEHTLHFLVIGIGGDGLRGEFAGVHNTNRVFSAHADAPEVYDGLGALVSGGKHYGHLEVNVIEDENDCWQAKIDPVYVFPVSTGEQSPYRFERRVYDDVVHLTSCRASMGSSQ